MRVKLEKQHYQWGITAFLVVVACLLVYFAISKFSVVGSFVSTCIDVLMPFIIGLVMAYLVSPIYNFVVRNSYRAISKSSRAIKHDLTIAKTLGTLVSISVIVIAITGVMWMVIPGMIDSIITVAETLPDAVNKLVAWIDVKFAKLPYANSTIDAWIDYLSKQALGFVTDKVLPHTGLIAAGISTGIVSAIGIVLDVIIGIIVCAYFLNIKDTLAAQAKKVIMAMFKESTATEILEGADYTNRVFGSFLSGKILDSIIIGIICFLLMSAIGLEYSLLISIIVGISNIIPFFGPFIGAVPSALLLLMVNPMHAVYFLILIVVLQQFDGNILGPKILGDSIGLESFWILFAILVGGGLFGFVGMVLGVPVFAVLYAYGARFLSTKLKKKGFSTNTADYKVDKYRVKKPKSSMKLFKKKKGNNKQDDNGDN